MKVSYWWKLASDESYLVMKVKIVKEVKRSDGLWRFACVNVLVFFAVLWDWCWKGSRAMSDCKQMGAMSVIGWQMGERVKGVVYSEHIFVYNIGETICLKYKFLKGE